MSKLEWLFRVGSAQQPLHEFGKSRGQRFSVRDHALAFLLCGDDVAKAEIFARKRHHRDVPSGVNQTTSVGLPGHSVFRCY